MTENEIIAGVVIAAVVVLGWIWWPKKEVEAKLDPVQPEATPAPALAKEEAVAKATTKKAPAKKAPAKKAPAKKAPAKKAVKKGKK